MFTEIMGPLLAGLGLFFVGVTFVSTNLKKMTSRKLKLFFSRYTRKDWQSALMGICSGFITQSTAVSAFIVAGLTAGGMMTVRRALPVIFWANAGCSVLVLVAVLDISLVVFVLLFMTGVGYAFDRPRRFRFLVRALFGIGLLFLGLQMITSSAAPLTDMPWVRELLQASHGSNLLALGIGIVLTIVTQTSIGIILVAIAMISSGLFTVDQTIMIVYGAHLGSAVMTWFLASGVRGTSKQLIMSQVLFNIFGVGLMLALFYLEVLGGIPLVKAFLSWLTPEIEAQMAYLVILFNVAVPIVSSFLYAPFQRLLERLWPPTRDESLSKIKYIQDHTMDVPEAGLLLVEKELNRLLRRLPDYVDGVRSNFNGDSDERIESYHIAFKGIMSEIEGVLSDIADSGDRGESGTLLLDLLNRRDIISALEKTVHDFCSEISKNGTRSEARRFLEVLVEALDFFLMTAVQAAEDTDTDEAVMLATATRDRGEVLERIRKNYLEMESGADFADKALMLHASNLFERMAWLLNRFAVLLQKESQDEGQAA